MLLYGFPKRFDCAWPFVVSPEQSENKAIGERNGQALSVLISLFSYQPGFSGNIDSHGISLYPFEMINFRCTLMILII